MKKTWGRWLIIFVAIVLTFPLMPSAARSDQPELQLSAETAALIDVESGRILWSNQGDKQMLIASTTKILTTIVAIENGDLSDNVTVGPNAYGVEGSSLYLQEGEKMSLHHLLYGLMLRSGNDAAVAIAEHVGGSIEGFALMMNRKAEEIGMENSHFVNPHGLNAEDHYSTAEDMAKLTAYALKNPVFQEIVKTKIKKVPNPNEAWDYTWYNKNKMLTLYDGADGVKTGYTKLAGRCLVSSATRDGRKLAVVTLNAPSDWADHARLLDYGFEQFEMETLAEKGEPIMDNMPLVAGTTFRYPFTENELEQVRIETTLTAEDTVEYRLGERGRASFYLGDEAIGQVPLVEPGSSRLNLPMSSETFRFQPGEPGATEANDGYFDVLQTMFKGLFVWSI